MIAVAHFFRGFAMLALGEADRAAADFKAGLEHFRVFRATTYGIFTHPEWWNAYVVLALSAISEVARVRERAWRAGRLAGAAEAFSAETRLVFSYLCRDYHRIVAASHARLDDSAMVAAWAEGQQMTLDQAMAYALQESEPDEPPVQ
jgi:hypothetical protein